MPPLSILANPFYWNCIGKTHCKHLLALCWFNTTFMLKMDYAKIFVSSVLVIVFYILFGCKSIEKLMQGEKTISHTDKEPKIIKAPGLR